LRTPINSLQIVDMVSWGNGMQQLTRSQNGAGAIAALSSITGASSLDVWRDRIHDLGNLIQVATSAINMIARDLGVQEEERSRTIVSAAQSSLERAAVIVRMGLRDVRDCPIGGRTVIADCFSGLRTLAAPLMGSRISLDFGLPASLPAIGCDADCLERALVNLVINARDATPQGGSVYVSARIDGPHVVLAVEDNGCGMSRSQQSQAVQPYYTTKASGTGVGLATVRDFMGIVGGELVIASEPGIGTCIELRFPRLAS
jgi:signal transduction histidine kinase